MIPDRPTNNPVIKELHKNDVQIKHPLYTQSLLCLENNDLINAMKILLQIKSEISLNNDPWQYVKVCRLIIYCTSLNGYQDSMVENLEEVFLILQKISKDQNEIFKVAQQLVKIYIQDLRAKYDRLYFYIFCHIK